MHNQALSGVKVVEIDETGSAAYCTKLMADMGAEVIKIEPPEGDKARKETSFLDGDKDSKLSGSFLYLNTNKKGITLDVTKPAGYNILLKILKDTDVLVINKAPSFMERNGLLYENLKKEIPRLIVTSITPFGISGAFRDFKSYDINATAMGGINIGIGEPGREPLKLPLEQTKYQAGVIGSIATMMALFGRNKTGNGEYIDISEIEVWSTIHTGTGIVSFLFSGRIRNRTGHRLLGQPYPHTILPCKDGFVALQASERHHWAKFVEMVGNPEWINDEKFQDRITLNEEYGDEADALLAPWLASRTKEEIFALCRKYRVPGSPVYTVSDVLNNEHLKQRGYFVELEHGEAGVLKYPGIPYKFLESPGHYHSPAPLLGEHDKEIFCDKLGISDDEFQQLKNNGCI
jgi:CoA:oxalate CoA-transferase